MVSGYRGRVVAWLTTQRKSFDIEAQTISEKREGLDYWLKRVTLNKEDIAEILEEIHKSCQNLAT